MQKGGPGLRAALSSCTSLRKCDRHLAAEGSRSHDLSGNTANALLRGYQGRRRPLALTAKPEPQRPQSKWQVQSPVERPRGVGAHPGTFWVRGTRRTGTRRRTSWAYRRLGMGCWKVSSAEIITPRRGGQGDAAAPADPVGAVTMIALTAL